MPRYCPLDGLELRERFIFTGTAKPGEIVGCCATGHGWRIKSLRGQVMLVPEQDFVCPEYTTDAFTILSAHSAKTGWNENTALTLACDFIDRMVLRKQWDEFLASIAQKEQEYTDESGGEP